MMKSIFRNFPAR